LTSNLKSKTRCHAAGSSQNVPGGHHSRRNCFDRPKGAPRLRRNACTLRAWSSIWRLTSHPLPLQDLLAAQLSKDDTGAIGSFLDDASVLVLQVWAAPACSNPTVSRPGMRTDPTTCTHTTQTAGQRGHQPHWPAADAAQQHTRLPRRLSVSGGLPQPAGLGAAPLQAALAAGGVERAGRACSPPAARARPQLTLSKRQPGAVPESNMLASISVSNIIQSPLSSLYHQLHDVYCPLLGLSDQGTAGQRLQKQQQAQPGPGCPVDQQLQELLLQVQLGW